MSDLTTNAPIRILGTGVSEKFILDTSTSQHIFKGQPLFLDQDVDAANVRGFVDADVVAATDVSFGIAAEEKRVSAGDPETVEVEGYVFPTIVGFKSSVFAMADVGKTVYMSDSATLSSTAADNPEIGTLYLVRDGYAYVQLSAPKICAGA